MKRTLLIITALLIGLGSVNARKEKEIKSDLVGIWQLATLVDGELRFLPNIKIINKDGTFSSMSTYTNQNVGQVYQKGRFAVLNDSIYREVVTEHYDSSRIGMEKTIRYALDEKKTLLFLDFVVSRESWVRISDKDINQKRRSRRNNK